MRRMTTKRARLVAFGTATAVVATLGTGAMAGASAPGASTLNVEVSGTVTSTQGVPACELTQPNGLPESATFSNAVLSGEFGDGNGNLFTGQVGVKGGLQAYPTQCLGPAVSFQDPNTGATVQGLVTEGCLAIVNFGAKSADPRGNWVEGFVKTPDTQSKATDNCDPKATGYDGGDYINLGALALANLDVNFCVAQSELAASTCAANGDVAQGFTTVPSEAVMSIYIDNASPDGVSEAVVGPVVQNDGKGVPPVPAS